MRTAAAPYVQLTSPQVSESGKTCIWKVTTVEGTQLLGEVRWYSPWRKYAFFPRAGTLYEQDCLRVIANMIEQKTAEHRSRANLERKRKKEKP
jgi:hypothetical protein